LHIEYLWNAVNLKKTEHRDSLNIQFSIISSQFRLAQVGDRQTKKGIFWCLGRESNSHDHKDQGILSPLCLPIPPPRREQRHVARNIFLVNPEEEDKTVRSLFSKQNSRISSDLSIFFYTIRLARISGPSGHSKTLFDPEQKHYFLDPILKAFITPWHLQAVLSNTGV
jgi:hypothetical protein